MPKQKIRIKLKGYDHKIVDQSVEQIVATVERTGAVVVGPVPLPTRIQKFSVIRSPFIDKDSQESSKSGRINALSISLKRLRKLLMPWPA